MNKYKIVSLVLAVALVAALARLVYSTQISIPSKAEHKDIVLNNIYERKSVRNYTKRPVSREQLDTLLHAAMAAPTGRDMRPWKFIVLDDSATLLTLPKNKPNASMHP